MVQRSQLFQNPRLVPAALTATIAAVLLMSIGSHLGAQGRGQAAPGAANAQAGAPIDLTGYWVSLVTEDWRFRMVTPPKGDYASVPLNAEGRRVADTWDPAKDAASEDGACKSYGAAAIMRVPGRLHITWDDPNTLKIETDAGRQTRVLHFGNGRPPEGAADRQGYSAAVWENAVGRAVLAGGRGQLPTANGGGGLLEAEGRGRAQFGNLKVDTTRLKEGYLRKNGVPYSENAVVTEYFDRHAEFGTEYLTVTTMVRDPKYLAQDFITSTDFKKEPDGAKWNPAACTAN